MTRTVGILTCVFAVLTFSTPAFGQAADSNLVGLVVDSSGAGVPDATLDLENVETGVKHSTRSGPDGGYRFHNIPVGRYVLKAGAASFTGATLQNVVLELNKNTTANVTLQVSTITTTLEVLDAAALIDTTTAAVQTTFEARQALELPISGTGTLGVINLSLLSAGVGSSGGVGYGTGPSVGGQRPTNNNFMIEGADNNYRSVTGRVIDVPAEAVSNFTLMQNQFSAEFGHSTGGQFNVVVKGGTNALHGSVFETLQNRKLNAIDQAFARQGILKKPRYDQNTLGASIGGPILKNKLFYYGLFQYSPLGQASTSSAASFAPTAEGFNRLNSLSGLNKTNLDIFKQYVQPAPAALANRTTTVSGAAIPLGVLNVIGPSFENNYNALVSGDYSISGSDQLRLRYFNTKIDSIDATANLPVFFLPRPLQYHLATLSEYHLFSPHLTNEFRLSYTRRFDQISSGDFKFPGLDAFPNITLLNDLNVNIGPNPNAPQGGAANTMQLIDNVNWNKGRHTLKFGYDARKLNISSFFIQRSRGDYRYNTLERFLLDITPEFAQRSTGAFPFSGNLISHYAFAKDEFRLRPNLTVTLGIRYEFVDVPAGAKLQRLNSLASVPGVLTIGEPKPTKNDWAPRFGIAYSPGTKGTTSIRGGFGMGYDQVYQNLGINSLPPQFFTTVDAHIDQANQPNFLARGGVPGMGPVITDPARARALTASFIPDQLRPYSLQWNVGVQRVWRNDYTVEVRYLGSRGVHLPYQIQLNRAAGVTRDRSLPLYLQRPAQADLDRLTLTLNDLQTFNSNLFLAAGFRSSITAFMPQGNSSYHGLAAQVTKRYSRNLQLVGAYTWSHNIDDSTAALNSTVLSPRRPQDFQNLRPERAASALDRRHRFTVAWIYDTPWFRKSRSWALKNLAGNLTVAGTYMAESPEYGTVQSSIDANLNGDPAADRFVHNPAGDAGKGSDVTALTNSAGRTVAYLASDPSARYIRARQGLYADGGRNTLPLRGINNFDMALIKKFSIGERRQFEFRGQFYNAFNHAQFTPGYPSAGDLRVRTTGITNLLVPGTAVFNNPETAFQSNARTIQLVARFQF